MVVQAQVHLKSGAAAKLGRCPDPTVQYMTACGPMR